MIELSERSSLLKMPGPYRISVDSHISNLLLSPVQDELSSAPLKLKDQISKVAPQKFATISTQEFVHALRLPATINISALHVNSPVMQMETKNVRVERKIDKAMRHAE